MSTSLPDESTNVKWMYEGANSSIDREQYLLGKRINKLEEEKGDFVVQNVGNENLSVSILERLDYESKVREDPLFSIRKKEDEKRRELLSNPVKRKRLQSALKNALIKDLSSTHSGKKRRKKSSKKSRRGSSSEDSSLSDSSDEEEENKRSRKLIKDAHKDAKLHAALKKALEKDLKKKSSSESENETRNKKKHKSKKKHHKNKKSRSKGESQQSKKSSLEDSDNDKPDSNSDDRKGSKRDDSNRKEGYGLILVKPDDDKEIKPKKEKKLISPVKEKYVRKEKSGFTRKLNKDELERKRREMMDNANWRDEQRRNNVKSYKQEEEEEREREEKIREVHDKKMQRDGKVKTFLHDMKLKQASIGSLEDTVRRKRHRLDRSNND